MGGPADLDRALAWLRTVLTGRAQRVVEVPGGLGVLHGGYPAAHDHNQLLLWRDVDAPAAAAAADRLLGGAGLTHRRLSVQGPGLALALHDGLLAGGYRRERELLLACPREVTVPAVCPTIEQLTLPERVAVASAGWREEQPGWPAEVTAQLGGRIETVLGVVDATFLAVREGDRVVAHADLFVRDGVAQVEEVMTEVRARNRGLASALVRDAVRRGRAAGADLVFLVADADDWPAGLYRRLGFTDLGATASYQR